ncbi:unannotated protein [freshwater metagenome]|uniref:Unannotated protein n=1 Tax=freshwater metagenome TaxID=449393 RepID=A0A6J6JES3_9ZZZZ
MLLIHLAFACELQQRALRPCKHLFELALNLDNDRYTLVQHLLFAVLHGQLPTHLVSNNSDMHPFDPKTFEHTRRKYLNVVTANTDRDHRQLQDLHPNQGLTTLMSQLQLECIHLSRVPCRYLRYGKERCHQCGVHKPNRTEQFEYYPHEDHQLGKVQILLLRL